MRPSVDPSGRGEAAARLRRVLVAACVLFGLLGTMTAPSQAAEATAMSSTTTTGPPLWSGDDDGVPVRPVGESTAIPPALSSDDDAPSPQTPAGTEWAADDDAPVGPGTAAPADIAVMQADDDAPAPDDDPVATVPLPFPLLPGYTGVPVDPRLGPARAQAVAALAAWQLSVSTLDAVKSSLRTAVAQLSVFDIDPQPVVSPSTAVPEGWTVGRFVSSYLGAGRDPSSPGNVVDPVPPVAPALSDAPARTVAELAEAIAGVTAAQDEEQARAQAFGGATAILDFLDPGSIVSVPGFVFPVAGPRGFSDSWGAPRMSGTIYAHAHQGTDIFGPYGTPLVAVERGVVTLIGTAPLGGLRFWLVGESGNRYYYAHLAAHDPSVVEGMVVEAGQVLAYLGNSGNARGTPPHLHFEMHAAGGTAVNPYPLLQAVDAATAGWRPPAPPM